MTERSKSVQIVVEDDRTGMSPETIGRAFLDHVMFSRGKHPREATPLDRYMSLALMVRDRLVQRWIQTHDTYRRTDPKRVHYFSAEFLIGRSLRTNLLNVGIYEDCKSALSELGVDLADLLEREVDAGLGNGGLGRLAACFLDSLATLGYPAYGYGIRYEFGIFEQAIEKGFQIERPDEWLKFGNPWEIMRPEYAVPVSFYGRCEEFRDKDGQWRVRWVDAARVLGVPYDTPIAGYATNTVNTLRLWQARASEEFDLDVFNQGDYVKAVEDKNLTENISKVLYPSDNVRAGRELRLKQQYFFVACSLRDILRRYMATHTSLSDLPQKIAIQLNDTHPSIAVAELMRLLVDERRLPWETAWDITRATFAYTNHTLLAEALERWPVSLFERLLPRHLQIIFEINRRFLAEVDARWPGDAARAGRMSLVEDGLEKHVRMAHLAVVGSHAVNGVAKLHTELLRTEQMRDFDEMYPGKFSNKTNGITSRRWLLACNPLLSQLITSRIGDGWVKDLDELEKLAPHADDAEFRRAFFDVKQRNKTALALHLKKTLGVEIDTASLYDVQIKRIHEYKRQLLAALHAIGLYLRAKRDPTSLGVPRTLFIAGKAAPGYRMAKLIIKLITAIGEAIDRDPTVRGLKVSFLPNYRVSLAEQIIPAADLSEQISTAGKEASGTGNMKLSLNGALTIGTLDGANIEIRDAVGPENFFLFGMSADQVAQRQRDYRPRLVYEHDAEIRQILDLVASGFFSGGRRDLFEPIVTTLLEHDPYMVLSDYAEYSACQQRVSRAFEDQDSWTRMAILNVAHVGRFSSDRTIREYADEIWGAKPVAVSLDRIVPLAKPPAP